ncbi:hypothetical protein BJX66DRAFT_4822 [Aspergillus keveii]|uniref:Uncharacterized protein n=1 Tax=Aspergillus keveii TaxID=714993 RepID=A0ABR4GQ76_9EURO
MLGIGIFYAIYCNILLAYLSSMSYEIARQKCETVKAGPFSDPERLRHGYCRPLSRKEGQGFYGRSRSTFSYLPRV